MKRRVYISPALVVALLAVSTALDVSAADRLSIFAKDNLVAWCVVPFDAANRGPEERAQMLDRLGIKRLAYDFRDQHIRTFDQEIDALQKHGIELTAFWMATGMEPEKDTVIHTIFDLIKRRGLKTQLWTLLSSSKEFDGLGQEEKLARSTRVVSYIAKRAKALQCSVGLYNHGGWFGEPENQIEIIRRMRMDNVGIVYNFHHGHEHIDRFPALLKMMQQHLLCLNLNGMRKGGPKILPLGQGDHELKMLKTVQDSGYDGPVGILDHRDELDAELSLKQNIDGLRKLTRALGDGKAPKSY